MRKHLQGIENVQNNTYRIIAVDDEEGIVDSLSIFLKRSGYDFTGVTDPQKAIDLVKEEHFDLMILDFKFRIVSIHNLRFKTYNYGIFLNNVYRPNASTINNKAPIKAK